MAFTLNQIKEAQGKVTTGADFPRYAMELASIGVKFYETFVENGNTVFSGSENFQLESGVRGNSLKISVQSNSNMFIHALKIHQNGQTDFPTFCRQAAEAGVEKWRVDLSQMTCTYFNKAGDKMLVEKIPAVKEL